MSDCTCGSAADEWYLHAEYCDVHREAYKECRKCQQFKKVHHFSRHASTKDRRQTWCKACKNRHKRIKRLGKEFQAIGGSK